MNTIEASTNALKLSYLRFVSDSAPGLMLILGLATLDLNGVLPFTVVPGDPGLKAIAAVAAILLASPIGLLVNGAGHFLLGGLQQWIDRKCFTARWWPLAGTRVDLLVDEWKGYFSVEDQDWPRVVCEVDDLLDTFVPHLSTSIDHVRALKKLCRSLAFLAIVSMFAVAGPLGGVAALILLGGCTIPIVMPGRSFAWIRLFAAALDSIGLVIAFVGCCEQSPALAVGLLLTIWASILLAGMVDFYQHSLTMLFVYQLLVKRGESLEFGAESVRERLARAFPPSNAKAQKES